MTPQELQDFAQVLGLVLHEMGNSSRPIVIPCAPGGPLDRALGSAAVSRHMCPWSQLLTFENGVCKELPDILNYMEEQLNWILPSPTLNVFSLGSTLGSSFPNHTQQGVLEAKLGITPLLNTWSQYMQSILRFYGVASVPRGCGPVLEMIAKLEPGQNWMHETPHALEHEGSFRNKVLGVWQAQGRHVSYITLREGLRCHSFPCDCQETEGIIPYGVRIRYAKTRVPWRLDPLLIDCQVVQEVPLGHKPDLLTKTILKGGVPHLSAWDGRILEPLEGFAGVPSCVKCGITNEYQVHGYTCWACSRP